MREIIPTALPDMTEILAGQLTPSSIAMYQRDVNAYAAFAAERGVSTLDPHTLISWRDHLATATSMSPNTINRMLSAVRRVVKEAAKRGRIPGELALLFRDVDGVTTRALKERLKVHARTRIAPEDMRRVCSAPDTTTLIGTRDAALLATMASSGIRASELAGLRIEQIEQQGPGFLLKVQGKTDVEYRDAYLSVEAKALIDAWLAARPLDSPYVFTSFNTRAALPTARAMSTTAVWLIVQKYARAGDLTYIKPHDFRRFVGTQLAKDDIRKAQRAMGHKSIETTARHYVLDELTPGLTDHLY